MPRRERPRVPSASIVATLVFVAVALVNGSAASATMPTPSAGRTTSASNVPSPPRGVNATPGDDSAIVHWSAPASTGGAPITGYVVTAYLGTHAAHTKIVGKTGATKITGLDNTHTYAFHVQARNRNGRGPAAVSNPIVVGTPTAPSSVAVTRGDRQATVSWHASMSDNGSPVTGYVLVPYLDGRRHPSRELPATDTTTVVTDLAVGRSYQFAVGARNARGVGPRSPQSEVVNPTSALGPDAPPPAGGWFDTLPVDATLPSEATCDGRVHYSDWEPRTQNTAANHRVPKQPFEIRKHPAFYGTWQTEYRPRVTGNFTGTTDEIIQWAACKWGLSDEVLRAQADAETSWRMGFEGDKESRSKGLCTAGDDRNPCPTSFGILQIKWYFNPDSNPVNNSYPMSKTMTAFSLDYAGAKLRGCYEGWEYFGNKSRGNLWGCVGAWYSGEWHDKGANEYIERVKAAYEHKPWRNWPG
jgi:hypothetical protein